jgi:hypothetical protein
VNEGGPPGIDPAVGGGANPAPAPIPPDAGVLNDGGRGNADGGGPLDILGIPPGPALGFIIPGPGFIIPALGFIIPGLGFIIPGPGFIIRGSPPIWPIAGVSAHAPGPADGGRPPAMFPMFGPPMPGVGPMPSLNEKPCGCDARVGKVRVVRGCDGARRSGIVAR